MPSEHTQTTNQDIVFPTGTEVYDGLMVDIEPELLSSNIPHLDAPYVGESEEDHKKRYERYTAAFAKYDEAFAKWEAGLKEAVAKYRRDALKFAEDKSRSNDVNALSLIESAIAA